MIQNNNFKESFIGKASLSKTLRNELIPVGKTSDFIEQNGIITEDELRAEKYQEAKQIIDDYHRDFIERSLINYQDDWTEFFELMQKVEKSGNDQNKKELEMVKKEKRKNIVECFKIQPEYEKLFKEELIKKYLPKFISNNSDYTAAEKEEKLEIIGLFNKFSSYFTGFHKNRENIYTDEAISTSVAYRVVDENSKIFYENMNAYKRIKEDFGADVNLIEAECAELFDGWKMDMIFSGNFYNFLLIQKTIEYYNNICGAINTYTNEYCQKNKLNRRQYKMKKLHKQILSITYSLFELPAKFENDEEVYDTVSDYIVQLKEQKVIERVKQIFSSTNYNMEKIYVFGKSYTNISKAVFGNWSIIDDCLLKFYDDTLTGKGDKKAEKVKKAANSEKYRSIKELNELVSDYYENGENDIEQFENYFLKVNEYAAKMRLVVPVKDLQINLIGNEEKISDIKMVLDEIQELLHLMKPFIIDEMVDKDVDFYSEFDAVYSELSNIVPIYNMVRNYVTQKPYKQEKIKLNFGIPTLADGWDKNKETDYNAMLFMRDGFYYLGIYNAKNKPAKGILDGSKNRKNTSDYKKMIYKLLPGPNKMLPKVFLSKKGISTFNPSNYILNGYNEKKHIKGNDFDINFCHDLIDFFKDSINKHSDWKEYGFKFTDTKDYTNISEFYKEISEQGYSLSFEYIDENVINELINKGQLYFFRIHNKDFAPGKKGKDNLHTMYLKNIFSEENLSDVVIELNGHAAIFYRKSSIKNPYVHKKGEILLNKKLKDGTPIPDEIYKELLMYLNNKNTSKLSDTAAKTLENAQYFEATMDIVKDKRYSVDKFLFHIPITINYKVLKKNNLNEVAFNYIAKNRDSMHVIGIDRGERNLIYVSVIDMHGNIIKQKSYNIVNGYNYQKKLVEKERARDAARKSWKEIGKIAELKEGYLSQVIHEIAELMLEYNAVIVMENLNVGFKRSRLKVERQVYQKFEKMLIDKLNYFVIKDEKVTNPGGLLRGYQLSYKENNLEKLGRQCGMIFYVPAAFTSQIDPTTGFVNVFKFKELTSGKSKKEFLMSFDNISYDVEKDMFAFKFDYNNFATYRVLPCNEWTVYSNGERVTKSKDKISGAISESIVILTDEFKKIFSKANIDFGDGHNLIEDIALLDERSDLEIIRALQYYFKLTVQMRNSLTNDEAYDKIISPVINSAGTFFMTDNNTEGSLPADADANGAYNIALKGLYLMNQITENYVENQEMPKAILKLTDKEWFDFIQNRRFEK